MATSVLRPERGQRHAKPLPIVERQDVRVVALRTCTRCGEYAMFVPEGNGSWYVCSACGRYG